MLDRRTFVSRAALAGMLAPLGSEGMAQAVKPVALPSTDL